MKAAKWIIPITGFRETIAQQTGLEKIWKQLRPMVDAETYLVTPYEWHEDMRGLVDFILRNSDGRAEAMVIAYSWGCGVGFETFAREAARVGLPIKCAVLCDPVYRSRLLPTWLPFNPLSMSRLIRLPILIPPSVKRVEWVRQAVDYPRGHELVAEDPTATQIGCGRYLMERHTSIDDAWEFHAMALKEADLFVYGSTVRQ